MRVWVSELAELRGLTGASSTMSCSQEQKQEKCKVRTASQPPQQTATAIGADRRRRTNTRGRLSPSGDTHYHPAQRQLAMYFKLVGGRDSFARVEKHVRELKQTRQPYRSCSTPFLFYPSF